MFVPPSEPTSSQLRYTGGSIAVTLAVVGSIAWLRLDRPMIGGGAIATALVLLVSYYAVPSLQRPILAAFRWLTYPLTLALGIVLLSLVFFAIILPIGLARKCIGRDAITKRFDRSASTYWQRSAVTPPLSQYFRMY